VNRKAVVMLSGGLDSTLALKMMMEQGIEVLAVSFVSPFCTCTPKKAGCSSMAVKVARENEVPIEVISKGMEYMRIVENPRFGVGKGINPCIDCRIFMLRKVRERLDEWGAGFVVTGEVVGQRPMSQHMRAMKLIEKESGLQGILLRPLSAHLLPPTEPERLGIVDRERLLAIQGRSRQPQFQLAETLGVDDYLCPAGGCLLTDPIIAARLRDLFDHNPDYTMTEVRLVRMGRHFRINESLKVIVGRNHQENMVLERVTLPGTTRFFLDDDLPGPTALTFGPLGDDDRREVARMVVRFAKKVQLPIRVVCDQNAERSFIEVSDSIPEERLDSYRLQPRGKHKGQPPAPKESTGSS